MGRLTSELMVPSVILIMFVVVIGFLVYGGGGMLGLSAQDTNNLISIAPGVIALFISFFAVAQSTGALRAGAFMGVGLSFALLIRLMNQATVLIPSAGIPAGELSVAVIVLFMVIASAEVVINR